jgi:hypothetical protein
MTGTGTRLTIGEIYQLALQAGFTGDAARQATAIALHESGGPPYDSANPDAVNTWDINAQMGTPSIGLMQIIEPTAKAHGFTGDLNNPAENMKAAYMVSGGGRDWSPWTGGWNQAALSSVDSYLASNPDAATAKPAKSGGSGGGGGITGDLTSVLKDAMDKSLALSMGIPTGLSVADYMESFVYRTVEFVGGSLCLAVGLVLFVRVLNPPPPPGKATAKKVAKKGAEKLIKTGIEAAVAL